MDQVSCGEFKLIGISGKHSGQFFPEGNISSKFVPPLILSFLFGISGLFIRIFLSGIKRKDILPECF